MIHVSRKMILALALAASATIARAEQGVTDNQILLGQTVGETGTVAAPVKETNEGANAYFDLVNKAGGVYGRKIKLLTLDDKFDPKLAEGNAEKLINQEHVFALFQGRGTPHTQKILPLLEANHVPLLAPSTGATVFHTPVNHWVFNVRAKYQTEVAKEIDYLTTLGIKSIALLHVDDAFGRDGLEGFNAAMAKAHLRPVLVTQFARVHPDNNAAAATIIKANPTALIIVSSSENTIGVIKALRAQNGNMMILTLSNNSSQAFVRELGSAGNGIVISQIMPAPDLMTSRLGQEFQRAIKTNHITVSYASMEGFVNAKVLVEGLRRAGPALTREGFVRALESMKQVDLGGLEVSYGEQDHTGSDFVDLTMINKDGRLAR